MSEGKEINIHLVKGTVGEYIIKDRSNIIIGTFTIVELDKENKKCNVKLKFYKENNHDLLIDAVKDILRAIFKDNNVHKANFIVNEKANLKVFLDLGFTLEGIFTDNVFVNGHFLDELSFGINRDEYNLSMRSCMIDLVGDNIQVRNFTPEDTDILLQYYIENKEHLNPYEPSRDNSFYSHQAQKEILLESYRQLINGTGFDLGIFKDNRLVGKARLSNVVYGVFKNAILGYSMDKREQGKGYMKEAVNLILEYARDELDLHRIEASVLVDNDRSKNVLLACDFMELGVNTNYLFINGAWRDHITFYKILKKIDN